MSYIVELSDFKCEAAIPGLFATAGSVAPNNIVIQNKVTEFRDKYEKRYLDLFFEVNEAKKEDLIAQEAFRDAIRPAITNYIAYWYFRDTTVSNTPIGATIKQGENSRRTSNSQRMALLFNEAVEIGKEVYETYYNRPYPNNEIFCKINIYNL